MAQEHGTSFEEDITKREPYEQEHEEIYMNSITGETEVKTVSSPTIKRFFVIGDEPKLHVPIDYELKAQVRTVRDKYMQTTQIELTDIGIRKNLELKQLIQKKLLSSCSNIHSICVIILILALIGIQIHQITLNYFV